MNEQQEKDLTAFLTALSEQEESLPAGLQAQLTGIGQNLEGRVMELRAIAASIPSLNQAYQAALSDVESDDSNPKATLVSTNSRERSVDISRRGAKILTDADPVQAAKKEMSPSIGQIASNPFKRLFGRG
ncbi:hypothetical protein [cf. Phormidesmis sp. LEGE 11477]|uniref:hypothetical protein n=1 Tax=cf. Phormidesmis sp. LEGE 11477 TaxID=1828680 RepID=UPI001881A644|nr:hypothetical protein [cf. Phormidesmis sp. LEGE 11477]MBE9059613.1 hypothetical protein [cf. Phormidesmis sp. LEGE 11477]